MAEKCGTCQGSGQIRVTITSGEDKGKSEVQTCPVCNGSGTR